MGRIYSKVGESGEDVEHDRRFFEATCSWFKWTLSWSESWGA